MPDPLSTVLLTRPEAQTEAFARRLRMNGFEYKIVQSPLMQIEKTGATPVLASIEGVIFSSRNAVSCIQGKDMSAWCVGESTAGTAQAAGWRAVSAGGDSEALFQRICADQPKGRLLHLRGEHSRGKLAQRLTAEGIPTDEVILYKQSLVALTDEAKGVLLGEIPVILPLFSPRTARHFAMTATIKAPLFVLSMSKAVASEVDKLQMEKHLIASRPTVEAMLEGVQLLKETV